MKSLENRIIRYGVRLYSLHRSKKIKKYVPLMAKI
jgi:hypothetical protein